MKKGMIVALAIIVLAAAGWIIYGQAKTKNNNSGAANTGQSAGVLSYSNKGLTSVGSDIYNQTSATSLDLSNNSLKTLPSQMGRMTSLGVLKLDHNLLDGLIAEVRLMPLTTLDVSYNNMTGMPAEIGQLNKLVTLSYSYNKITGLPNELANLKNNLKTFDLTGNPLSQATINKLKAELPKTQIIF